MSKAPLQIVPLPAFQDNYIWLLGRQGSDRAVAVDPGDAVPVLRYLTERKLNLTGILVTHHHSDHIGGLPDLAGHFPGVSVFGPANETISLVNRKLHDGDVIEISELDLKFGVLDVPGHTIGHIAYHMPDANLLFCGDTLFAAGCGRLFEGTAGQLYESLNRLAALPEKTQVFCAHEYTQSNIEFARKVMPANTALQMRALDVSETRECGKPSLPSSIELETVTNPFLRVNDPEVRQAVEQYSGMRLDDPVDVFKQLRKWKDRF
jgi:hydroxyacylglutathione hydrolase